MRNSWPKLIFLVVSGCVLAIPTGGLFWPPFILAIYRNYGRKIFWSVGFILTALLFKIWFLPLSFWVLCGIYSEAESKNWNWWLSVISSISAASLTAFYGGKMFFEKAGIVEPAQFKNLFEEFILRGLPPQAHVDIDLIYKIMPALIVSTYISSLALGLILEKRWSQLLSLKRIISSRMLNLQNFRLPDVFMWTTLIMGLFFVFNFGYENVGLFAGNFLVISSVLYMFQGFAILECYFDYVKAGAGFRLFSQVLILLLQLFLLLVVIGFADFWIDFRSRMRQKDSKTEA